MKYRTTKTLNERGSAGTNAIIAIFVVAVAFYAGLQIIPAYYGHWNFEDAVETKVRFAFVNYPGGSVKEKLLSDVRGLLNQMPVQYKEENIKLQVEEGNKKITIEIWYQRTINLPFFNKEPKQFYVKIDNTTLD